MARFFYGGGESSDEPRPGGLGVQAIVQHTEHDGWHVVAQNDFYIREGDEWIGVDLFGALDYMFKQGHLLAGRTVSNADYAAAISAAIEYRDSQRWQPQV